MYNKNPIFREHENITYIYYNIYNGLTVMATVVKWSEPAGYSMPHMHATITTKTFSLFSCWSLLLLPLAGYCGECKQKNYTSLAFLFAEWGLHTELHSFGALNHMVLLCDSAFDSFCFLFYYHTLFLLLNLQHFSTITSHNTLSLTLDTKAAPFGPF